MGDEEAIIFCDKALEIDQNLVEAWNNKGNPLNKLIKYDGCYRVL
jgi:hypothetical protein